MSCKINCESGSVLIETAMVAPVIILLLLFGVDLFIFSQNQTIVTQLTRDSAIYLATVPGTLSSQTPFNNVLKQVDVDDWGQACDGNYAFPECPHLNAQSRVNRMLDSSKAFLDVNNAQVVTTYTNDGMVPPNKFVSVSVSVPVNTLFHMMSSNATKTIRLRRVET